ncbi:putative secreted protein [Rhizoctonia solani 123E]|uniref:Putative secreted protein n=1 Tax=Rhizoctonia solani 123E TaxID=1423351 RepID=A0A074SJ44_9AGAM|nr:putative secreted protein [Rhizoctonia solani 123E]
MYLISWTLLLALVALTTASPLNFDLESRQLPTPVSIATAKEYLDGLEVAFPVTEPSYDRKAFRHWIPIDGKCDTRETVLKRDAKAEIVVDSECKATTGDWISGYDSKSIMNAHELDIDHLVPLKEAWGAGAWNWTAERRKEFANDLTRPQLLAVSATSNRMKGDRDPSKWMPSNPSFHCTYIRSWIQVKQYYELTVDQAEKEALTRYINEC